jgi:hypothetical protein
MEWINVNDSLPEEGEDVLTFCISDGLSRGRFPNTYEKDVEYLSIDQLVKWSDISPSFRTDRFYGKVTHWMSLPNPPEK